MLLSSLLGLILTAGYAAALVALGWRLAVRPGIRWLPLAWLLGALVFAVLTFAKLRAQSWQTSRSTAPRSSDQAPSWDSSRPT